MYPHFLRIRRRLTQPLHTVLLFLCLQACTKKDAALPLAIRNLIATGNNCNCDPFLDRYTWRGQTIYLWSCRGPACNCTALLYTADGNQLQLPQDYTASNFVTEARFKEAVWRCE